MMFRFAKYSVLLAAILGVLAADVALAQGPPGRGPDKVAVASGHEGIIRPQSEFQGTVYFKALSEVATEVRGKVTAVMFEVGQRVRKGQLLVKLDDELLKKDLGAMQATLDRDRTELQDAEVRFERAKTLVGGGLTTSEQYDEYRFDVKSSRYQVIATEAELERIETTIAKTAIYAPFDGIVVARQTEIGEWRSEGDPVAAVARENDYEIIVDVPERYVAWVRPGDRIEIDAAGRGVVGTVTALVPRGDIATRTFPVKIRVESDVRLLEGMTALALLPTGEEVAAIIVPRDALLHRGGRTVVFTVIDGAAREHTVDVIGFDGMSAGIAAPDLAAGDRYIVKGHERLRTGALVQVVGSPFARQRDSDD